MEMRTEMEAETEMETGMETEMENQRMDVLVVILTNVRKASTSL